MYGSGRRRRLTIPAIPARCILQPLRAGFGRSCTIFAPIGYSLILRGANWQSVDAPARCQAPDAFSPPPAESDHFIGAQSFICAGLAASWHPSDDDLSIAIADVRG